MVVGHWAVSKVSTKVGKKVDLSGALWAAMKVDRMAVHWAALIAVYWLPALMVDMTVALMVESSAVC